jgi:hypothetical protein
MFHVCYNSAMYIQSVQSIFQSRLGAEGEMFEGRSSKLLYDWRSVSQYVLVSSTLVGLAIRYYFLSECCCLKSTVMFLLGALSDERTGLQFAVQSLDGLSRTEPVTIFYCLVWDSPNMEGQVPVFISHRNRVASNLSWLKHLGTDRVENISQQSYYCGDYLAILVVYRTNTEQRLLYSFKFRCRCVATVACRSMLPSNKLLMV